VIALENYFYRKFYLLYLNFYIKEKNRSKSEVLNFQVRIEVFSILISTKRSIHFFLHEEI